MKFSTSLTVLIASLLVTSASAQSRSPSVPLLDRTWAFGSPTGMVLKFQPCGSAICATVVALGEPGKKAVDSLDIKNPNRALRSRAVCGLQIVTGLTASPIGWSGGRAYNPADGSSVNVAIVETQSHGYIMRVVGIPFLAERLASPPANPLRPCAM
jgi:uncharacterized protein (DUF2147 family)